MAVKRLLLAIAFLAACAPKPQTRDLTSDNNPSSSPTQSTVTGGTASGGRSFIDLGEATLYHASAMGATWHLDHPSYAHQDGADQPSGSFNVGSSDPHGFDENNDGIGRE